MPKIGMPKMLTKLLQVHNLLTRTQKILAVVVLVIVALFVTGMATQDGRDSRSGDAPDPTENGLVKMLGGWFGGPDQAEPGELSAPCLADGVLTIESSCVLTVAPSEKDIREVLLRTDQPLHLTTRAPRGDTMLEEVIDAGGEIKVTVDDQGAEITLSCAECTVKAGE